MNVSTMTRHTPQAVTSLTLKDVIPVIVIMAI